MGRLTTSIVTRAAAKESGTSFVVRLMPFTRRIVAAPSGTPPKSSGTVPAAAVSPQLPITRSTSLPPVLRISRRFTVQVPKPVPSTPITPPGVACEPSATFEIVGFWTRWNDGLLRSSAADWTEPFDPSEPTGARDTVEGVGVRVGAADNWLAAPPGARDGGPRNRRRYCHRPATRRPGCHRPGYHRSDSYPASLLRASGRRPRERST